MGDPTNQNHFAVSILIMIGPPPPFHFFSEIPFSEVPIVMERHLKSRKIVIVRAYLHDSRCRLFIECTSNIMIG